MLNNNDSSDNSSNDSNSNQNNNNDSSNNNNNNDNNSNNNDNNNEESAKKTPSPTVTSLSFRPSFRVTREARTSTETDGAVHLGNSQNLMVLGMIAMLL